MLLFQIISLFQHYVCLNYVSQEVSVSVCSYFPPFQLLNKSGRNIFWEQTSKPPYEFPTIRINNLADVRGYKGKAKLAPRAQAVRNDMQYLFM